VEQHGAEVVETLSAMKAYNVTNFFYLFNYNYKQELLGLVPLLLPMNSYP